MPLSPFKTPWHFDPFRKDQEGEYVKIVGNFVGDWSDEIELLRTELAHLFTDKPYNEQGYGHAANKPSEGHRIEDLDNPDGDPSARIFKHFKFQGYEDRLPKIQAMVRFFRYNLDKPFTKKLDDQFPNDQLMWHIDNLPGNPTRERVMSPDFKYQDEDKIRFLIMLEDWQPGQILQFGNITYTQWRAGMILAWDWSTLPHVTWNGSWHKRMALQLTGAGSETTWRIVREGKASKRYAI